MVVCFKLPHAAINSIGYDFPLEKYKVAYLSEHTWYTTFRRQSVFGSVGAFFPPRFVSEGVRRVLRKTQTGGTHRSTCAQTVPHWDKGQPEKGQKARGSGGGGRQVSTELYLGWFRIQRKGGPPRPTPHRLCRNSAGICLLDVIEESLAWIKDSHSGIDCKGPRMVKVHPPGGLGLKFTCSGGHQSAHGLPCSWPSLATAANIKGFVEVLTGCVSWQQPRWPWLELTSSPRTVTFILLLGRPLEALVG